MFSPITDPDFVNHFDLPNSDNEMVSNLKVERQWEDFLAHIREYKGSETFCGILLTWASKAISDNADRRRITDAFFVITRKLAKRKCISTPNYEMVLPSADGKYEKTMPDVRPQMPDARPQTPQLPQSPLTPSPETLAGVKEPKKPFVTEKRECEGVSVSNTKLKAVITPVCRAATLAIVMWLAMSQAVISVTPFAKLELRDGMKQDIVDNVNALKTKAENIELGIEKNDVDHLCLINDALCESGKQIEADMTKQLVSINTDLSDICCNTSMAQRCPLPGSFAGVVVENPPSNYSVEIQRDSNNSNCGIRTYLCTHYCQIKQLFIKHFNWHELLLESQTVFTGSATILVFLSAMIYRLKEKGKAFVKELTNLIMLSVVSYFGTLFITLLALPNNAFVQPAGHDRTWNWIANIITDRVMATLTS